MKDAKVRRHIWVSGDVQGVFYRETTRQLAERYRVSGWVKNLPDGRVEAVLEGTRGEVEALLQFCGRGPDSARVAHLEVKEEAPAGEQGFRILR